MKISLPLCALLVVVLSIVCIDAHTTGFCYRLDTCTGLYEAAYATYHTVSGDDLPSGGALIDGVRTDFTSASAITGTIPPGFSNSDCFICQGSNVLAAVRTWQFTPANINLDPGTHTVTLSADSYREEPCSGGTGCTGTCWPRTFDFEGVPAGSIDCPSNADFVISGPNDAIPCVEVSSYATPTCEIAACPTFSCFTERVSGITQSNQLGITQSIGLRDYTARWAMRVRDAGGTVTTPATVNECTVDVRMVDNAAPENVACPDDISQLCEGPTGAVVSFSNPTSDDCSNVAYTPAPQGSNSLFAIGTSTVTFTATDPRGNSATCDFIVEITSNPPEWELCNTDALIINFPAPLGPGLNSQATITYTDPRALSGCGLPLDANLIDGPASGSVLDVIEDNPTQVTWQSDPDPVTGEQIICSWEISFGYVQLLDIVQFGRVTNGRVALYIPFTIRWEFVNLPIESASATLFVTDGTATYEAGDFNVAFLEHEFHGISKVTPGPVDFFIVVNSSPSFVIANSLSTIELITGNENYW